MKRFFDDSSETASRVCSRYADGATLKELARDYGTTTATVAGLIRRSGGSIRPRNAFKKGEESPLWKGASAKYSALHARLYRTFGKPESCSVCGATGTRLDYANLTGNYADMADYAAMCRVCHRRFDAPKHRQTRNAAGRYLARQGA